MSDFHSDFQGSVNRGDIVSANNALMRELAKILIRNRADFVHLLEESGIAANPKMSDYQLINLFIDNVADNKNLALGASLLVNIHNRKIGFDGEYETSDEGVKDGYAVIRDYFSSASGEMYSNAIDPVTAIAETIGKGVDLGSKGLEGRQKKKYGMQDALLARQQARDTMNQQVMAERQIQQTEKNKNTRTLLIVGGVVLGIALIAGIVYAVKKRGK